MDSDDSSDDNDSSWDSFENTENDNFTLEPEQYRFLTNTEQIFEQMEECIKEVDEVVQMPHTVIRMLMESFCWDMQFFLERFYDDQENFFKEANIANPFAKGAALSLNDAVICQVCLATPPSSEMSGLECGHAACNSCWSKYLTMKITSNDDIGQTTTLSCPVLNCSILIDDATVMKFVTDPEVRTKYLHLITSSFVEYNRYLQRCPSQACNNVLITPKDLESGSAVTCPCGLAFCVTCGKNDHEPVPCAMLHKWIKRGERNSFNMLAQTQNIQLLKHPIPVELRRYFLYHNRYKKQMEALSLKPKIYEAIEKQKKAQQYIAFHQPLQLERLLEEEGNVIIGEVDVDNQQCITFPYLGPLQLERFLKEEVDVIMGEVDVDNQQYIAFHEPLQLGRLPEEEADVIMGEVDVDNQQYITYLEEQKLEKGVDVLFKCRQTLMNTFVFASFLGDNCHTAIFEIYQNDLDSATEVLSEYLQRDITNESKADIIQRVLNQSQYCDILRRALTERVSEGYDKKLWIFIE